MMKKTILFGIGMLFYFSGFAQQEVTVRFIDRPMRELIESIQNQTAYRIYCAPEVSDSLSVSVEETHAEPLALLRKTLQSTDFQVSVFQHAIYIIKGRSLITSLPGSKDQKSGDLTAVALPVFERDTKTDSIGKPEMERSTHALPEVTVLAGRLDNIRSISGGTERLQMRNVKNVPTVLGEADIIKIVMTLPGVKSAGEISSGFNVRGGSTDQNLILYNDGTIYVPTHLFGLFSAFNPDIVDNMELYKSGIPAKYGGRISSVLDITTRDGSKDRFQGMASLGLLTSRLTLEAPLFKGKGSFIVSGRTTYSDWLLKQIPEKSGYSNGTAGFYDINGSMNYAINKNNTVYLTGYYSSDRFSFSQPLHYAYQTANFSAKWRHVFNPQFTSTYIIGHDHYNYSTTDRTDAFNAYSLNFNINQSFAKADFSYYLNDKHTLNAGINSILYGLNPGNYLPAATESLVKAEQLQTEKALESAVYLSDQWEVSSKWLVSAGIRYSMFNVLGPRTYFLYSGDALPSPETVARIDSAGSGVVKTYHSPEFRLSARYLINEVTSIKAGVNTMRQYIHKISNTTIMSPTDTWKLSDVNIRPQSGVQYVAGFFRNFAHNTVEGSVEAYYRTMNDYLDYRSGAQPMMNPHIETDVVGVKGKAYGVEVMFKKELGKLNGWVSYTWSRTLLHRNEQLSDLSKAGDWYPADFDKPNEAKLVGNYQLTHRYSFSLNCDYSTGRPITYPESKYTYNGSQYVYYSERNQYRIPDYFRIDLSFNIEAGHRIKATQSYFNIGVYNLTGRKNAYSVYFVSEGESIKGYQMTIFGAPIPYLSYNIKF